MPRKRQRSLGSLAFSRTGLTFSTVIGTTVRRDPTGIATAYSQHSAKSRGADLTPQLTFSGGGSTASRRARLFPFRSARGHLARRGGQAELRWWYQQINSIQYGELQIMVKLELKLNRTAITDNRREFIPRTDKYSYRKRK